MNARTLGIMLGIVVVGITFAGGAAAQDSPEASAAIDATVTETDAAFSVDAPTTTSTQSIDVAPLTGCCCCEWRYKPSLNQMSDIRTATPATAGTPTTTPTQSVDVAPRSGCCCCEWRFKPSLNRMSDLRIDAR